MRFRLRILFIAITWAAIICGLFAWVRGLYYIQLRRVASVLAEFPEIDKVWLGTNDDVILEVEQLFFSTVDQPQSIFHIGNIEGDSKSEIRNKLTRRRKRKASSNAPMVGHVISRLTKTRPATAVSS